MNKQHRELEALRSDAGEIFRGCLVAVNPYKAVKRFVHLKGESLMLGMEGGPET